MEGKRGKQQKIENRVAGPKCQHVSNFSMLFCCLLPFAIIFVCDVFLLFNLIQILICHFFFIYLPCFSFILHLVCMCATASIHGSVRFGSAQLQLQRSPLYKFIHNSNLSKNINIRLKRLTLCYVCPYVHLDELNGCRWNIACSCAQPRSYCHCIGLYFYLMNRNEEKKKKNRKKKSYAQHHIFITKTVKNGKQPRSEWTCCFTRICLCIVCHLSKLLVKRITHRSFHRIFKQNEN